MFTEYKTARNKVKNLVRNAKKLDFRRLVENNEDIYHKFSALGTLSLKGPILDRRKFRIISQLMHLMTTFSPLQKP